LTDKPKRNIKTKREHKMENKPEQHLLTAEATPDAITEHSYLDKVRGLGSIGEERQAQLLQRSSAEGSQPDAAPAPEVPQPTPAEVASHQASLAPTQQKSTAEKLEAAANTEIDRKAALANFDKVANPNADAPAHRNRFKKLGASFLIGAGLVTGIGSTATASSEEVPRGNAAIERVDPGITPFKSEEAKAAATFGTPEYNTQKQFGEAERSWQVEGKLSADKVGKPMETETTDKAFESLVADARTNADVYAQLMVGCDDKLACTDLDKIAAAYDAATPAERQEKYEALEKRLADAKLGFETWDNYGTTFTNTETKSVNWNNDRRTDGVKILRVTLPNGEVFHVVTECEQLAFQPEQAEQKKLHSLPMLGAAVAAATTAETPDTPEVPSNPETPEVPNTPETPETPSTPENPENPEEPETPTEEENPGKDPSLDPEEQGNNKPGHGGIAPPVTGPATPPAVEIGEGGSEDPTNTEIIAPGADDTTAEEIIEEAAEAGNPVEDINGNPVTPDTNNGRPISDGTVNE
jgi:hypothetical protein